MSQEPKNEAIEIPRPIQDKYFLISKRATVVSLSVLILLYLFAYLSSEFVFSVTSLSEEQAAQLRSNMEKIPCSSDAYVVEESKVPKRNPWLLERYRSGGRYTDILFDRASCASLATAGTLANPQGKSIVYYFDRATDKPVIKVTYESLK